jgi:hypothetical protein
MNLPRENHAYDLVASYPAMEFTARVARRAKYSAPIVDEFVIRVVHAAGEISVASVGGLLRLTGAQLESFTEPMLRSGLLTFTDDGLLALGPQGRQAMRQASGEPPKLSRVEEATEQCSVDVFENAFSFKPSDRRLPARLLEVLPAESSDRAAIRERVRQKLLEDYFDHLQYLELYGLRTSAPKQIEYVIDLDDGWGDRGQLSARITLDDQGMPTLEYPDLRSAEQLQKRRMMLGYVESALSTLKASVPALSQQFFLDVARRASSELQQDDSLDAIRDREYWLDDGVLATGRLESRSRLTADGFVDRVIAESGLLRGGKERTITWLVALIPELDLFVAGRAYRAFLEGTIARFRRRSPKLRVVAVTPYSDTSHFEKTLRPLFNAHVSGYLGDQNLAGIDGLFIPDELAYVVCSDVAPVRGTTSLPRPRSLMTTRLDAVRELSGRVFGSSSLAKVKLDGISAPEWQELSASLRKLTERKQRRVLKLGKTRED